ncbi:MAG: phosphorybosylanthranilate isomerase, partial [Deltaproteobacteria bacterium]|nr:phosphorybosylanthranilate isomerase [Deltaproteobacteria bacterium]
AGFSGLVLENFGDAPFVQHHVEPHIVAAMTRVALEIRHRFDHPFTLGINVLRNDARSALAIASMVDADFIRVNVHIGAAWTDQGLIQGNAYNSLMYRKQLGVNTRIAADILVKHAHPAGTNDLSVLAKDSTLRGGADVVILTGARTGTTTSVEELHLLRSILPQTPIWIGSGITPQNILSYKEHAKGVIIGSYLHEDGNLDKPLCSHRANEFGFLVPR